MSSSLHDVQLLTLAGVSSSSSLMERVLKLSRRGPPCRCWTAAPGRCDTRGMVSVSEEAAHAVHGHQEEAALRDHQEEAFRHHQEEALRHLREEALRRHREEALRHHQEEALRHYQEEALRGYHHEEAPLQHEEPVHAVQGLTSTRSG